MVGSVDQDETETEILDPLVLRARARIGTMLRDKWRLDALLGLGGMAAVFAATHRNGSRAAVKVLHVELSLNPQVKTRFLREGYVANAVGHDGAVKVLDDDVSEDGSLFLVTELLDGETIEERRLRFDGRLDADDVLSLADQLLDVLVAAHAKGIVHRDLKPENVFLTRAGQVKVLDFGIARLRELSTKSTATKAGSTMGTPAFMPPEQARALWDEVDGQSDLWAVGATMYTLLTGRYVHEGRTTNEVLLAAMTKPAEPIRSLRDDLPPAVARLVDRALSFEKSHRPADAAKMQEAVRGAYHDRHGAPISTAPQLVVPEHVPNRTLPSNNSGALQARLPTTGQPVARSSGAGSRVAPPPFTLAIGGLGLAAVLIISIAVVAAIGARSKSDGGRVAPSATTSDVSTASSALAPGTSTSSATGSLRATDLPTTTSLAPTDLPPAPPIASAQVVPIERLPTARPPKPRTTTTKPPPVPTTPKLNCDPPFTMKDGIQVHKAGCR